MERTIYIETAKAGYKLPVGCSQWWGNPDLPKELEYPTYRDAQGQPKEYQFIGQINLEEVALLNPSTLLPHKGLLSFFGKIDYFLGKASDDAFTPDRISSPDDIKVFYFNEGTELEEVVLMNEDRLDASSKEMRMVFSTQRKPYAHEHGLFLPPDHREWETWAPPYETWKILFQVDSCDGDDFHLNFKNRGVMDFLISPEDLEAQRFDNVRAIILPK